MTFGLSTTPTGTIAADEATRLADLVERYRLVMEATNEVLWDWDLVSDQVTVSEAVRTVLGHDPDATRTTGAWWLERVHPDDRARVQASLQALFASDASHREDEYRFRRGDGSYAIVFDRGVVVREGGRPVRMVGAMADVTARRMSEAALEHRTADLRAITGAFPDVYFWKDADGRILDYQVGRDVELAMPPSEFLGKRDLELFPGELGEGLHRTLEQCLRTGEVVAYEYSLVTPSGRGWYEARYVPIGRDRVISIIRDITRRRTAEEELRRRDEQYRLVTDGLPVLISYVDRDGRYQFVNRAHEQMFERPREDFIGVPLSTQLGTAAYARLKTYVDRVLGGEAVNFENTVPIHGKTRHVTASYVPHRAADGTVQGFFALVVDVTEHRRLEEQLRHAQKMEALGRLAGGIAHDFNNLLMVIGTATEFARRAIADGRNASADLDTIAEATQRAGALTRQLLAFSRRDVTRHELVDVDDVVRDTEKMLRRVIGEHIQLVMALASEGTLVLADRGHLEQVVMNLAINARDAMPAGGTLTLRTARRVVSDRGPGVEPGTYVEITVADTGVGMEDSVRRRAFEPFFTTKDVDKGTGLGLAMVYGIATQYRGTAVVESAPGAGTTFRVYFPDAKGEVTAPAASEPVPQPRASERVLLVEDEGAVRALVRRALEAKGYAVIEAADGPAALALAERHASIDIMISDVIMPRLSGPALVEQLRARWPRLPVLFMSGYPEHHMKDLALSAGTPELPPTGFLAKPFTLDEMFVRLRQLLDGG